MNKKPQEFELHEFGWWIGILTGNPSYKYYFGDFETYWEARWAVNGYIQDLEEEGAKILDVEIERCQPKHLTIDVMPFSA